jgi:Zn-dependent protease/predicted transcriptional regulator
MVSAPGGRLATTDATDAGWARTPRAAGGGTARERSPSFGGIPLGRLAGVRIAADWSLLVVFALVTFQLGSFALPRWHPDWSAAAIWTVALAAAVLFFASILVHELSHALVAKAFRIRVHGITLFLFGGMAHIEGEPRTPKQELLIAAIGPVTSLAIGVGATVIGSLVARDAVEYAAIAPELAFARMGPVATILLWLGPVNVALALFNLVPGFPLDGGRVLRALLWWGTKDLEKATRWAAGVGVLVGWALVALGILSAFGGSFVNGVWMTLIGLFLSTAARSSYEAVVVKRALADVPVARVMRTDVEHVPPDLGVDVLVDGYVMRTDQQAFPVVDGGRLVGIVCLEDVRRVPRHERATTAVSAIMTPGDRLRTIQPETPASEAFQAIAASDVDQLPVVQGDALVGLVRRRDLLKWLAMNG